MLDVQDFRQIVANEVNFDEFIVPVDGGEMPRVNTDRLAEYVAGIASDLLTELIDDLAAQTERMTSAHAVRDHVTCVLTQHADLLDRQARSEA